jgi:hypothetical protein
MIDTPSDPQQGLYRPAFANKCLLLIVLAHRALETHSLPAAEEPEITGLLVKCARDLAEMEDAEPWLEHLEILDDPPQNDVPERLGKARPRIDIEFVRTGRGKRPRFHIEAKRLYRSDSVGEYFGPKGLEMFLNGTYASQWPSAGMLGYVQTKDAAEWTEGLNKGFSSRSSTLSPCSDQPALRPAGWPGDGLSEVHESCHSRTPAALGKIDVYHLLLEFL